MLRDKRGLFSGITDIKWLGILFIFLFLGGILILIQANNIVSKEVSEKIQWEAGYASLAVSQLPLSITELSSVQQEMTIHDYLIHADDVDEDVLELFAEKALDYITIPEITQRNILRRVIVRPSYNVFIIHEGEVKACAFRRGREAGRSGLVVSQPCERTAIVSIPGRPASVLQQDIDRDGLALALHSRKDRSEGQWMSWVALPEQTYIGVAIS